MHPDPYTVLGVPRDADEQQIRRAYRRLAKRHHPDLQAGAAAQSDEQMRRVNQAWETLSDPQRRARHDADSGWRRSPPAGHWSAPPRHATQAPAPAATWGSTWTGRGGPRPGAEQRWGRSGDSDDGPGWGAVAMTVAIGLVAFVAAAAGILPLPLLGFVALIVAGRFFDRDG